MKATLISPTLSDPQTVMPRSLVWLFAIASGLSVANVYYAQPLLDALARDFAIGDAAIGGVIAATQIGCAMALLLLVPLGDRVNRRRLMATQVILLIAALAAVSMASTAVMLLGCMLAVGLLGTAMTQGLIAYAASAAAPARRVAASASICSRIHARSPPAQKLLPSAASTTTRTALSAPS